MALGEGKRESDKEEYGLVVEKVMRKNICCSQKPAVMGRGTAVGLCLLEIYKIATNNSKLLT